MMLTLRQSTSRVLTRTLSASRSCVQTRCFTGYKADSAGIYLKKLRTTFPYAWLRDSCQAPTSIHPSTLQKLHRSSDIPVHIKPAQDGIQITPEALLIRWEDGHESTFTPEFLRRHSSPSNLQKFHGDVSSELWDAASIKKADNLFVAYDSLKEPQGQLDAIVQLLRYGLIFVTGVPTGETSDETCELRALAAAFGRIRYTFYGHVWNVRNIKESRNIAYTNLDLGLHMDLLYHQHPPQYQILHCLRNRVKGGSSIFVDSFKAADDLRLRFPSAYDLLSSTLVPFHYINDGHHMHCERPTFELTQVGKRLKHVNYSPPFQAPLLLDTPSGFYEAMKRFADILGEGENRYEYLLREGDAVLFDNRRVLHSRTAFEDIEGEGTEGDTNRWLKGCYLDDDTILDKMRGLRKVVQEDGA
ncbi:Clavaminate synthase-like protein [Schizophyllum commune Tattone D]|nr:Clavaminate synthase-like protein [Schizophyllum commune Tattone D]